MVTTLRTVSAYQSLLREDDYDLKQAGLKTLLSEVNLHWSDIANDLNEIEKLYHDPKFPNKQLAAILLSRIYYNLNDYKEALNYALDSGNYFNIEENGDFVEVLVNKSIEHYIEEVKANLADPSKKVNLEYKKIVDKMVEKSLNRREYRLGLGISLDSLDLELAKRIIAEINLHELVEFLLPQLDYLDADFRKQLLSEISKKKVMEATTPSQYINLLIVLKYNEDFATVSSLIYECVKKGQLEIAYTLALEVSEMNGFNLKVANAIPIEVGFEQQRKNLMHILEGKFKDEVQGVFLKKYAKTDPHYQTMLKGIEIKSSVAHGSALLSLSMLQAYTQDGTFLEVKENLEWAAKCTHWAKFASIASLGLIFRNTNSMDPFKPFLPEANKGVVNHFPNGGALYGLGLVYTGTNNQSVLKYLLETSTHSEHSKNDVVMHGACLGMGLTSFATGNNTVGDRLKEFMNISSSVIGEAAALSIGLVYAGTTNDAILGELINFAQETEHEKILRSICLAIGIVNFQRPSKEFLNNISENPKLKLAVPHYLACAYFKTSNHDAVRKLLDASNDISNEVKRAAVIGLGFVMYHDPHLVQLLQMMIYSYNPSIRYGCALALMVGAKQSKEVLELLWPLLTDAVDYVRQAAYISVAVLLQINTVHSEPKLADFRKMITESIGKKHEDVLAKMGAILATGLLDIGGRNMTVSLTTRSGIAKIDAVIGMLVFSNFWNWFPFINFIGMTITASAYIGVTSDLKIPTSFELRSTCKPSMYDYPPNIVKEEKKEEVKKDTKVELSTTNKVKVRAHKKKGEGEMDVEPSLTHQVSLLNQMSLLPPTITKASSSLVPPTLSNHAISLPPDEKLKEEEKKQQKKEDLYSLLKNPHRVAERQKKYLQFVEDRYVPILPERKIGICFLKDTKPGAPEEYLPSSVLLPPQELTHTTSAPPAKQAMHLENIPEDFQLDDDEEKSLRKNEQ